MNFLKKLFAKPYVTKCMEMHGEYECFISIDPEGPSCEEGGPRLFFDTNHFLICHNMFDTDWDEKTVIEEVFKKLILICNFDPNDDNIVIVYKNHERVYLPNNLYVEMRPRGVFVYDKSKIKITY